MDYIQVNIEQVIHSLKARYTWIVLVYTVMVSCIYVVVLPYWVGRLNSSDDLFLAMFAALPVIGWAFVSLVLAAWKYVKQGKGRRSRKDLLALGLSILAFVSLPFARRTWPVLHKAGFMQRLRSTGFAANIPLVKKWIIETKKPTGDYAGPYNVPRMHCPKVVREVGGDFIWLHDDGNDRWWLQMHSGGRDFGWGVIVVPEDKDTPEGATGLAPGAYAYTW